MQESPFWEATIFSWTRKNQHTGNPSERQNTYPSKVQKIY